MGADSVKNKGQTEQEVNLVADAAELAKLGLDQAREALSKLPILGPVVWLYGRDPARRHTFISDLDCLVLPPVILDQCRLYTKSGIPFAFFTWAHVSDTVDARLRSGVPKLAPHEWKSGEHLWLIDILAPFGQRESMLDDLLQQFSAGQVIHALLPDPQQGGQISVRQLRGRKAPVAASEMAAPVASADAAGQTIQ